MEGRGQATRTSPREVRVANSIGSDASRGAAWTRPATGTVRSAAKTGGAGVRVVAGCICLPGGVTCGAPLMNNQTPTLRAGYRTARAADVFDFSQDGAALEMPLILKMPIRHATRWVGVAAIFASSLSGCVVGSELRRDFEAVVHSAGGRPCFGVEDNAETRRSPPMVAFVEVSARSGGRAEPVWHGVLATENSAGAKRIPPGECVEYPEAGGDSAKLLSAGTAYSATLWTYLDNGGRSARRWYSAYFCMIEEDDGMRPHQVPWDDRVNRWDWSACGADVSW